MAAIATAADPAGGADSGASGGVKSGVSGMVGNASSGANRGSADATPVVAPLVNRRGLHRGSRGFSHPQVHVTTCDLQEEEEQEEKKEKKRAFQDTTWCQRYNSYIHALLAGTRGDPFAPAVK